VGHNGPEPVPIFFTTFLSQQGKATILGRGKQSTSEVNTSRLLTVLAAQTRPVAFDPSATLTKFEDEVQIIASSFPKTDLIVFPELYLNAEDPFTPLEPPGYEREIAEAIPGPLTERVGKIAARSKRWIVAGSILERAGDEIFNTAIVFSPEGELVTRHRKLMPWAPFEKTTAGSETSVFDIPGIGRIGLMICYEGWFPEIARGLALKGAEVIVQPSLTTTPDRAEELVLARAHAIVNQCFVVNVNAVATLGGGRSIAVDPEGRVLFEAGQNEELIPEVMDLDRVATVREHGTRGLNRVWQHFLDAPSAVTEGYRTPPNV
jgi:formamidase